MDTLLKAAEFVELSSSPTKAENLSNARGTISSHVQFSRCCFELNFRSSLANFLCTALNFLS